MALLEIDNLKTWFHTRNGVVKAVDDISFGDRAGSGLSVNQVPASLYRPHSDGSCSTTARAYRGRHCNVW